MKVKEIYLNYDRLANQIERYVGMYGEHVFE